MHMVENIPFHGKVMYKRSIPKDTKLMWRQYN